MDRNYFWHCSSHSFHTLNLSELSFSFCKIRRGKLHPKRLCITTVQGRRGWLQPGNVQATLTLPPIIILTAPTTRKQCQLQNPVPFVLEFYQTPPDKHAQVNMQKGLPWQAAVCLWWISCFSWIKWQYKCTQLVSYVFGHHEPCFRVCSPGRAQHSNSVLAGLQDHAPWLSPNIWLKQGGFPCSWLSYTAPRWNTTVASLSSNHSTKGRNSL